MAGSLGRDRRRWHAEAGLAFERQLAEQRLPVMASVEEREDFIEGRQREGCVLFG